LALLSFVRISFSGGAPKLSYRQSEDWEASTTFVLSGPGFAVGSVTSAGNSSSPVSLAGLAAFYARIAMSDDVQRLMLKEGPVNGVMTAQPGVDNVTSIRAPLPILAIYGDAPTPGSAIAVARRGARAFTKYVALQQDRAGIPAANRIQFRVVNAARGADLVGPRKKTLPIVIFLTIMTATIGLAFILENLRPRVRPVSTLDDAEQRPSRRSA
jgi:hypothetical protein